MIHSGLIARLRRAALAGVLLALPCLAAFAQAKTVQRALSGRPDRAMYFAAKSAQQKLEASPQRLAKPAEWEKVVRQYRAIVTRYPQSAYCDDALLRAGDLYRAKGERFHSQRDLAEAVRNYNALVSGYPSSSLAEQALFSAYEIELTRRGHSHEGIATAAQRYLKNFPGGSHASAVRAALRPQRSHNPGLGAGPSPSPTPAETPSPGLARVFDVRAWSGEDATRVVVFLEKRITYQEARIDNPDRLFVDLLGARLHPNLEARKFPVGDGLLQQVRVAQFNAQIVRIVLDFKAIAEQTVFILDNPVRLVIDVRAPHKPASAAGDSAPAPARSAAAAAPPSTPDATPAAQAEPAPTRPGKRTATMPVPTSTSLPADSGSQHPTATPTPEDGKGKKRHGDRKGAVVATATATPSPPPSPAEAEELPARDTSAAALGTPQPNRSGSYSLVRQLGLGARRIVIDPGHGGHDPGTIGRSGLEEKDLVLDVALRLERLVRERLHLDVVMTRRTDVFIPLEERTAIANAKDADLFLSIHVNSSRAARASGVETYYLSFAVDAHAEEVAARENAISPATLKDLSGLVRAIMQNSKIEESRDFATNIQTAMVSTLRPSDSVMEDRGVRRAPFYVLLGANMPSVLAEIAFVSHREEERLLRTPTYREAVAEGLLAGVRHYLDDLHAGKAQALPAEGARERPVRRAARR